MSKLAKAVSKKMTSMGLSVIDTYYTKGRHVICSDVMIVSCEKEKEVSILFNVSIKPDESASMTLEINKVKGVESIYIGDIFIYVENMENVLVGNDAIKAYHRALKQDIIDEFVIEQKQLSYLINSKCHEGKGN